MTGFISVQDKIMLLHKHMQYNFCTQHLSVLNMIVRKRQRDSSEVKPTDAKRLVSYIKSDSISSFEDLSNEIFYDIFEYLHVHDIYQGFFNLNTRFQRLIQYLNIRIKLNTSSYSKVTFQQYYKDFILPNQHRIKTIHLEDPFIIEYLFPIEENLSIYSQLQSLFLENIESKYLEDFLQRLIILPKLSSLTLHVSYDANKLNIYNGIFQLPSLKFCELSFEGTVVLQSIPTLTNPISPLEHFIINGNCFLNEVEGILSNLLHLRRLSIASTYGRTLILVLFNNSKQISMTLADFESQKFESFIQIYSNEIQLLHFTSTTDPSKRDIEQLQYSIVPYLSYSKTIFWKRSNDIICNYTSDIYKSFFPDHGSLSNNIQQWYFTSQSMSEEDLHKIFCSFQPHRKERYIISQSTCDNRFTCHVTNNFQSIQSVTIQNEGVIDTCRKSFPNAFELTFDRCCYNHSDWFVNHTFDQIISLTNLTTITINNGSFDFYKLASMLLHTPNVHTLLIAAISLSVREVKSIEENETFRRVSKQNKIKHLTIYYDYILRTIKMLIKLCPQVQHFTFNLSRQGLEPIVRYLLTNNKDPHCHLSSLCIFGVDEVWVNKLKQIIESKENLVDYSLKIINDKFFVWL